MPNRVVLAALLVFTTAGLLAAQAQTSETFEVVSIRANKTSGVNAGLDIQPAGRIIWTATTIRPLIELAYQRRMFDSREVVGGPEWIDRDRFDITAQAGAPFKVDPDGFPGPVFRMIRAMLVERFKLKVHQAQQERPIYALVAVRPGQLGKKLQRSSIDCGREMAEQAKGNRPRMLPDGRAACALGGPPGRLMGAGLGMPQLAAALVRIVGGREVVDRTGLEGAFDWDVEFRPEFVRPIGNEPPPALDAFAERPSIFTALEEQLGLRLESTRAMVDVLVVDSISPPEVD